MRKVWLLTSLTSVFMLAALLLAAPVYAGAPYDITVNFDAPATGPAPDVYHVYIDDCAATGAIAAPFASVTSGQIFSAALPVDGVYAVCVRSAVNKPTPATDICDGDAAANPAVLICEQPDPGQTAIIDVSDLPLPGPVENLDIQVACPTGGCTVTVTVN